MYCSNCGKNNADGSGFCSSCGNPLPSKGSGNKNKHGKAAVAGLSAGIGLLVAVLIGMTVFYFVGKSNDSHGVHTGSHNAVETTASHEKTDSSSEGGNNSSGSGGSSDSSKPEPAVPSSGSVPSETLTGSGKPSDSSSGTSSSGALYMGSASYVDWLGLAEAPPARYYNLCFAGDYAFYIDTDDMGLYRVNLDGTGHTRIHDIGDYPGELTAYNDEIYYLGYANGFSSGMPKDAKDHSTYGIHWVNKNGKESRIIEADVGFSYRFHNNQLIFLEGDGLWTTDVDATENYGKNELYTYTIESFGVVSVEMITQYGAIYSVNYAGDRLLVNYNMFSNDYSVLHNDFGGSVTVYDNKYYFLSDGTLYSVRGDGTSKTTVAADVDDYVASGEYIYYTDSHKKDLYRIKRDGTGKKMLVQYMYCTELVEKNNKIYFSSIKENGYIYSVTTDGKSIKLEFGSNAGAKNISDFLESGIEYFI